MNGWESKHRIFNKYFWAQIRHSLPKFLYKGLACGIYFISFPSPTSVVTLFPLFLTVPFPSFSLTSKRRKNGRSSDHLFICVPFNLYSVIKRLQPHLCFLRCTIGFFKWWYLRLKIQLLLWNLSTDRVHCEDNNGLLLLQAKQYLCSYTAPFLPWLFHWGNTYKFAPFIWFFSVSCLMGLRYFDSFGSVLVKIMGLYFSLMVLHFELFLVILLTTYTCFDAGLAIWFLFLCLIFGLKLGLSFPIVACLVSDVGVLFSLCCLLYSPQSDFLFWIMWALWIFVLIFLWVVWLLVYILSFVIKDLSRQQIICSDVWEYRFLTIYSKVLIFLVIIFCGIFFIRAVSICPLGWQQW